MPPAGAGKKREGGKLSRSGTRRLGDDYQDVVAIDLLVRWLGSNDEYEWFKLEADDALHLDDITAKRSGGSFLYRQVKYSTAPASGSDPWDWAKLLDRGEVRGKRRGNSLLEKWSRSLEALSGRGKTVDAAVVSNRKPGLGLKECLTHDGHVLFDRIAPDDRSRIAEQLGSEDAAHKFFASFRFELEFHGLRELEDGCRRRFVALGGTEEGWFSIKEAVSRWVCHKDEPRRGGRISLLDLHQAARWYGLKAVSQQFEVPADFVLASREYRDEVAKALLEVDRRCLVLTGSPGSGKSTFASHLFSTLREQGVPVIRHHYYLPSAGDYSPYQRAHHLLAAESLMHDLRHDYPQALGKYAARNPVPSPDELRAWLVEAGRYFQGRCERVVLILDGLDHVWRERHSAEELAKLLGPLLPPPGGVVVLLVTQSVSDDRLPGRLLAVAPRESWMKHRLLDSRAVALWLRKYLETSGGSQAVGTDRGRVRRMRELAAALWQHSGGHPLHLRYTLRAVLDRGLPLAPRSLEHLPGCPSEDITAYYRMLWTGLGQVAREVLHLVAACGFSWPNRGIPECLELLGYPRSEAEAAFREVRHLLSEDGSSIRPYHGSLVVFVREQEGHAEKRTRLLDAALRWLKERAPGHWRWAYTWPLQADLGDPAPLVHGLTRSWLVEAVASFRPRADVAELVSRGLWHAADRGDLTSVVRISLLCDYTIDAFERHDDIVASLLPALLMSNHDGALVSRLRGEIDTLHHAAILALAEHGAWSHDRSLARRCFVALRERTSNPRYRRHLASVDSREIIDITLAAGALEGASEVEGFLGIARKNRDSGHAGEVLAIAGEELRRVDDGKRLRELLRMALALPEGDVPFSYQELFPLVREATLHALERGWSLPRAAAALADHPLVQIHAALRKTREFEPGNATFPERIDPNSRSLGYTERKGRQEEFFRDAFFTFLANHLWSRSERNRDWLRGPWSFSWMEQFLERLDEAALGLASSLRSGEARPLCWFFRELGHVPRPEFQGNKNLEEYGISTSAVHAAMAVGFDLVAFHAAAGMTMTVSEPDIDDLRRSAYCFFDVWIDLYARSGRPLLGRTAWEKLCREEEEALATTAGHLPERARKLSALARVAAIHRESADALRLVTGAAECVVAHGDHKDMLLHDVLQSVTALRSGLPESSRPPRETLRRWLETLAPPIVFVGKYTDGDETGHLPGDYAAVLAEDAPDLLPGYHHWLTDQEEYDDAGRAFSEFLRTADLGLPLARAVARTAVERAPRMVLRDRADAGDGEARSCLESIEALLGPMRERLDREEGTSTGLREEKEAAPLPSPGDYPPPRFDEFLAAIEGRFTEQDRAIAGWAEHWERAGAEAAVLGAFEDATSRGHRVSSLDAPYRIARGLGDREQAFRWLVRAHRERSSWYWNHGPEEEAASRWAEVRQHYPERWLVFIRDTVRRYGYPHDTAEPWRGTALGHGGFPRLVRYCLALGKHAWAIEVVDAIVRYAVEYVTPVPLPRLGWLEARPDGSDLDSQHFQLLFTRLTWPSSLVRERASASVASLLDDPALGSASMEKLLAWLGSQDLESTAVLGLLPFCRSASGGRDRLPPEGKLAGALSRPSLLSDIVFRELLPDPSPRPLHLAHSGDPPPDFIAEQFFARRARNFLPPLFWERAKKVEQMGTHGFLRQWGYEWGKLIEGAPVETSTAVLDYWFGSSSHKGPNRAADPLMSELFRSSYLRALAWATDRGFMPPEAAIYLAAETCPVDLELWKIPTGRRPEWWPVVPPDDGAIDVAPSRVLALIERLWQGEGRGEAPWAGEWSIAHASGRVADGSAIYDAEIVGFLQSTAGSHSPSPEQLTSWLAEHQMLKDTGAYTKESEIAFRGWIRAVSSDDVMQEFGDWHVLPLGGNVWANYPVRWQWWRLLRPVWLPFIYSDGGPARFEASGDALVIRRGEVVIGQWRDWTDGLEETLDHSLSPPSGDCLLLRKSAIDELAARTRMAKAWAVRITCHHRKDRHERFRVHTVHQILGARTVIVPH